MASARAKSARIEPPDWTVKLSSFVAKNKVEITGVLLILLGALTITTIFFNSGIGGKWFSLWCTAFGNGAYYLPFFLLVLGFWVLLRNFSRLPALSLERLVGMLLVIITMQVIMHLMLAPDTEEIALIFADAGQGGGHSGSWMMWLLRSRLGVLGTWVAMIAFFVIGLVMTLDVSVMDLFRWVNPNFPNIQLNLNKKQETAETQTEYSSSYDFGPLEEYQPTSDYYDDPPEPVVFDESDEEFPFVESTPIERPPVERPTIDRTLRPTPRKAEPATREWVVPNMAEMLNPGTKVGYNEDNDRQRARVIEDTLASFGAPAHVVEINRGPTITQFGVEPDFIENRGGRTRVRVGKIASLADDLALALAASRIRIQAPVPGKGFVGIEVPNDEIAVVSLRDVLESPVFTRMKSPLPFALGQDVAGKAVTADLSGMPHLLVAGATGSGKSVFVNAMICGFLLHNTPATLRMIMVDPKRVELTGYNGVPHLLAPVVTDVQRVVGVLQWVTREMDTRYQKFADTGARNIQDFNNQVYAQKGTPLPYLVLIIDELADLMMIAPDQTERLITRMAQLARATGIHLVISTQRPSVDVVTGLIKANFPARISFAVASGTDSRVVLDHPGAERLLGRGDMLFQAPDAAGPVRLQGVFVSDPEIQRIVQYWRTFAGSTGTAPVATGTPIDSIPQGIPLKQMPIWEEMDTLDDEEEDNMYQEAVSLVRRKGRASISMLQRRLRIGYTRAARLIDQMEQDEIIGPATGSSTPREVIDYGQAAPPADED